MDQQNDYLEHFGIPGMKWGVRKYQNEDGSLTEAGRKRYGVGDPREESKGGLKIVIGNRKKKTVEETNAKREVHTDNDDKEEKDEPKQPLTSDQKKDIINSGDADLVLKNYREFSRQELNDALQRVRDVDSLIQVANKVPRNSENKDSKASEIVDFVKERLENREEKNKQKLLRSGDMDEILKNQDKFTTQELNDAINRSKNLSTINELKKQNSTLSKIIRFTTKTIDTINTVDSNVKKVKAWFDDNESDSVYNMDLNEAYDSIFGMSKNQLAALNDRTNKIKSTMDTIKSITGKNEEANNRLYSMSNEDLINRYKQHPSAKEADTIASIIKQRSAMNTQSKGLLGNPQQQNQSACQTSPSIQNNTPKQNTPPKNSLIEPFLKKAEKNVGSNASQWEINAEAARLYREENPKDFKVSNSRSSMNRKYEDAGMQAISDIWDRINASAK